MTTINAQTIINEVMAAHAVAPNEQGEYRNNFACFWPRFEPYGFEDMNESDSDYPTDAENAYSALIYDLMTDATSEVNELYMVPTKIKFQTAAKGFHTIQNTKENLQRFADLVRKNAAAFGGGLIREKKIKPAISYQSKHISMFRHLMEDSDYAAALDYATDHLSPLFFIGTDGIARIQVAPVPIDTMPGLVSVLAEDGRYEVIEPTSMMTINGRSIIRQRTRAAQIENAQFTYDNATPEKIARITNIDESLRVDQSAIREQWMHEHGIHTSEAIAARIETNEAAIEAQAAQEQNEAEAYKAAIAAELARLAQFSAEQAIRDAEENALIEAQRIDMDASTLQIDYAALGDRPAALYENGALDFDVMEEVNEDYISAQAAQDVAAVVADAVAAVAIADAMAEDAPELECEAAACEAVTSCEAGSTAQSSIQSGSSAPVVNVESGQTIQSSAPDHAPIPAPSVIDHGLPAQNSNAAEYSYAMVNRPFSLGTAPKFGFVRIEPRPGKGEPHHDLARHGIIVYDRQLTDQETKSFELATIADSAMLTELCAKVCQDAMEYAGEYVGMASKDWDCFLDHFSTALDRVATCYRVSVPSYTDFADMVLKVLAKHWCKPVDTLESFDVDSDGVSYDLLDAIDSATVAQVQSLSNAQFARLADHLENWNFHTENYMLQALQLGNVQIIDDMRQIMRSHKEENGLSPELYDQRQAIVKRMQAAAIAPEPDLGKSMLAEWHSANLENRSSRINAQSGLWIMHLFTLSCGLLTIAFTFKGSTSFTTYATAKERMQALQAMARAADAPSDPPPEEHKPVASENAEPVSTVEIGGVEGVTRSNLESADAGVGGSTRSNLESVPESVPEILADNPPENAPAEFERVKPVRIDLADMVANGVKPDALIGLGVYCSGDRANPAGSGAITGVSNSGYYGLVVDVTLESGYVWHQIRTFEFKDGWFSLNGKMHGKPYMSDLAMSVALAKSQKTSAEELAKEAHAKALIDLAAQYPQLKRAENTHAGGKLAAVNIRILLKAFKGVKFSVTSDYNSVRVNWIDGPTDKQVIDVIGRFDIGASDSQSDYFYTVKTAFSDLFGGVQYLNTRREESDSLVQEAIDKRYPDAARGPTVHDYRNGCGVFDWGNGRHETRQIREALDSISK